MRKIYFLLPALALAACNNEDVKENYNASPVSFMSDIAYEKVSSRSTVDNSWSGGEKIAVMIDGTVKEYTVSNDGVMTSETPFYWNEFSGSEVTVNAWYPYSETKQDVIVSADQSTSEGYQQSDFLEVTEATVSKSNSVLSFSHRGTKLILNVSLNDSFGNVAVKEMYVANISGVNGATEVKALKTADNVFVALIAGQNIAESSDFLKIVFDDNRTAIYNTGTKVYTLDKGKYYTFNVTVNSLEEVTVSAAESGAWVNVQDNLNGTHPTVTPESDGGQWNSTSEELQGTVS
ncbi:fimbrillin family protein [uncultured Bacteroides sp.]|uniref:fimbrillin family protein n=1 Tax=uncultured Bacteroides sp. TaxID=162156 RepID=UPI0025DCC246|nr:fimbrillin family protein [uncultured Bacteroides sp.]